MPKTCKYPGCVRRVWGGGYCDYYSHQQCRTDPPFLRAKEKKAEKPVTIYRIPKTSKKYAADLAAYNKRVKEWKKEKPFCGFPGCSKATDHCHHMKSRGKYLLVEEFWMPLCAGHHKIVEENPKLAKELNLSKSRLKK